jgi:flavin-dependent dehydrogenase
MESTSIGRQAVVVGAGMGGLPAARVLADFFEDVVVLERDTLPRQSVWATAPICGQQRAPRW